MSTAGILSQTRMSEAVTHRQTACGTITLEPSGEPPADSEGGLSGVGILLLLGLVGAAAASAGGT